MIDSNKILISGNSVSYSDEILKISNISRMSIVIYENRNYLNALKQYNDSKRKHEQGQDETHRYFSIGSVIVLFISFVAFVLGSIAFGVILLIAAGIGGFIAYQAKYVNFKYKGSSPNRKDYPERYGLCVNMNSGFSSYFTASKDEGLDALRELQKLINEADEKSNDTIIYQDNRVNVENRDGVINLGDNNDITNEHAT